MPGGSAAQGHKGLSLAWGSPGGILGSRSIAKGISSTGTLSKGVKGIVKAYPSQGDAIAGKLIFKILFLSRLSRSQAFVTFKPFLIRFS